MRSRSHVGGCRAGSDSSDGLARPRLRAVDVRGALAGRRSACASVGVAPQGSSCRQRRGSRRGEIRSCHSPSYAAGNRDPCNFRQKTPRADSEKVRKRKLRCQVGKGCELNSPPCAPRCKPAAGANPCKLWFAVCRWAGLALLPPA